MSGQGYDDGHIRGPPIGEFRPSGDAEREGLSPEKAAVMPRGTMHRFAPRDRTTPTAAIWPAVH